MQPDRHPVHPQRLDGLGQEDLLLVHGDPLGGQRLADVLAGHRSEQPSRRLECRGGGLGRVGRGGLRRAGRGACGLDGRRVAGGRSGRRRWRLAAGAAGQADDHRGQPLAERGGFLPGPVLAVPALGLELGQGLQVPRRDGNGHLLGQEEVPGVAVGHLHLLARLAQALDLLHQDDFHARLLKTMAICRLGNSATRKEPSPSRPVAQLPSCPVGPTSIPASAGSSAAGTRTRHRKAPPRPPPAPGGAGTGAGPPRALPASAAAGSA